MPLYWASGRDFLWGIARSAPDLCTLAKHLSGVWQGPAHLDSTPHRIEQWPNWTMVHTTLIHFHALVALSMSGTSNASTAALSRRAHHLAYQLHSVGCRDPCYSPGCMPQRQARQKTVHTQHTLIRPATLRAPRGPWRRAPGRAQGHQRTPACGASCSAWAPAGSAACGRRSSACARSAAHMHSARPDDSLICACKALSNKRPSTHGNTFPKLAGPLVDRSTRRHKQ